MRALPFRAASAEMLSVVLCLGACAGDGTGLDRNGRPLGSGGGTGGAITADFESIQDNVFTPICSVCHAGGAAPQGLRLDSANSFNLLVNVSSTEVASIVRIKPGDPDNSYLIQKIEGHASVGAQMPLGGPPLAADVIAAIRQWVTDGAQSAPTDVAPASFKLISSVPASGEWLDEPPPQIMLAFNQELDATRVDGGVVRLERAGEGADPVVASISARLSMPSPNLRALLLTPTMPLRSGHYRVLLRTSAGLELTDVQARTLILQMPAPIDGSELFSFDVQGQP